MQPYIHTVQYYETDRMRITHHSNYIRWMEEARMELLSRLDWPIERLEEMGIFIPVVAVDFRFKHTTTSSERISITVSVAKWTGIRMVLAYEMRKEDGTLAGTGTTEHCFLDREGRIIRLQREYAELYQAILPLLPHT